MFHKVLLKKYALCVIMEMMKNNMTILLLPKLQLIVQQFYLKLYLRWKIKHLSMDHRQK
jgi:hypothetical protein